MSTSDANFTQEQLSEISALEIWRLRSLSAKYVDLLRDLLSDARTVYEFEGLLARFHRYTTQMLHEDLSDINMEIAQLQESWMTKN